MKTNAIIASAIVALMVSGVVAAAFAHTGFLAPANGTESSNSSTGSSSATTSQSQNGEDDKNGNQGQAQHEDRDDGNKTSNHPHEDDGDNSDTNHKGGLNLSVGQSLTFSGLDGRFSSITNESSDEEHDFGPPGNATGSFTFKVTGTYAEGYNLTITSGTFTLNKTIYTVTGGTLTLSEEGRSGRGHGTASGGATFTIYIAGIHGNSTANAKLGAIKLDVKAGTSEYRVILVTPHAGQESSED